MKVLIANRIFSLSTDDQFESLAKEVFQYQSEANAVYREFVQRLQPASPLRSGPPPFLPIELFKHYRVSCHATETAVFKSSGTTGTTRSRHYVYDTELYATLSVRHFESLYGPLSEWAVLALLPSYIENGESSLVFMADRFIKASGHPASAFVLHQPETLFSTLQHLAETHTKTLLLGVSYALLDFAETHVISFPGLVVMETGGMKGRRHELTREELHAALKRGFPDTPIHSEYGMTELLSQAYSADGTWFRPPPWMKCFVTEVSDPLNVLPPGKRGLLAFIDLANIHSCAFVQTRDIGSVDNQGRFTVEGRLDNSDIRGCNLMYT